jgi:hypothetical protein
MRYSEIKNIHVHISVFFLQSFSSTGLSLAIDKWVPCWEDVLCSAEGANAKPSAK